MTTETTGPLPIWHIESHVTHKLMCSSEVPQPHIQRFFGLNPAYAAMLYGSPAVPCLDCVKHAAFSMGMR